MNFIFNINGKEISIWVDDCKPMNLRDLQWRAEEKAMYLERE